MPQRTCWPTQSVLSATSVMVTFVLLVTTNTAANEGQLAMGFRVGEVTPTSALVWARVTRVAERNWDGVQATPKKSPTRTTVNNRPIPIEERDGAVPGAKGELRVRWGLSPELEPAQESPWKEVAEETDFAHQFRLQHLRPATTYYVQIAARSAESPHIARSDIGSFTTAAQADQWQHVRFTVITGQMYYHKDRDDGFRIYPAMARLKPHFIVPTGDTVYYDRDNPRARTVSLCRYHWHRMYSLPTIVQFHRHVPGYWLKDDHDTFFDDCWRKYQAPWIAPLTYDEGVAVFREQTPFDQPFRTIRWGQGLQIWLVEVRDYRSPNTMPDGPQKSIWGREQKEWLQRSILASDATFRVLISPTPIVGPDNPGQRDNHANQAFFHEGNKFRQWTRAQRLNNFYVCCGDRHWQYMSTDPESGLREFSCGPASDIHAFDGPGYDPKYHSFYRNKGGFLSVGVTRGTQDVSLITFRFHDVNGKLVYEYRDSSLQTNKP